jgi:hypothetical protein
MKNDLGSEEKVMFQGFLAFLPSQKFDLVEEQKAMFRAKAYPLHLIFYILIIRKREFREAEKEFQVVFYHCLFIICLLGSPKCDLGDVGNVVVKGDPQNRQFIFLPPWRIKMLHC